MNVRCDQPVSLMDMYPTLVELAGYGQPSHLDGKSLVPQLKDPRTKTEPVITSFKFGGSNRPEVNGHTFRSLNYRYIYYLEINLEELYDHEKDFQEWETLPIKPIRSKSSKRIEKCSPTWCLN